MSVGILTAQSSVAQDIESLVMPGPLSEAHADLESKCANCHQRFKKSAQRQLCMDCHEDVAADVNDGVGYHGRHDRIREDQCAECHTEHTGRGANLVILDKSAFDHDTTDFALLGKHVEVECDDCHSSGKYRDAPSGCAGCHEDDDVHHGSMGSECGDCHNPSDWTDTTFDHDSTGWPLLGKHAETACNDCHADPSYEGAPTNCFGCHAEDDVHNGLSGNRCENCHSPTGWKDTRFDHSRDTDFPLLGKHALLTCDDCHSSDPFTDQLESTCIACHREDDSHDGHNGESCENCHAFDDWASSTFDHDTATDFALRGGHRDVACNDCHIEPIFEHSPGTTCESCHLEDDVHEGTLGTDCAACHTEVSWTDAVFFDHDMTDFPLLGKHAGAECDDCHETKAFNQTDSACAACHTDDDVHEGHFHERCGECHNPVGWDLWTFDHDVQTDYPLTGAHADVACESCHRSTLASMKRKGGENNCRDCHRNDDVHDGEFGFDCGRCHSTRSFREVISLQ